MYLNNDIGCTLATCPLSYTTTDYDPTLVGNVLYLVLFGTILVVQVSQALRYHTWSFSGAIISGLILEIVGYVGRVQMHFDPFGPNSFLVYIVCITVGPVFFAAGIYLILSRIIVHYGLQHARISPRAISLTFMSCDFIALVLQGAGGAIADTASTRRGSMAGTHIVVAGLAFQVFTLLTFIALAAEFARNVRRDRKLRRNPGITDYGHWIGMERYFKRFLIALTLTTIFILIRSSFRVAELAKGFTSRIATDEIDFMVFEGAMIILATATLTLFHPGRAFGARWPDAGWSWSNSNKSTEAVCETGSEKSIREAELRDVNAVAGKAVSAQGRENGRFRGV